MLQPVKKSRFSKKLVYEMHPLVDLTNVFKIKIDKRVGIVSDTHLGSNTDSNRKLTEIYSIFKRQGIKQVFHAGDVVDGERVYRGHSRHLKIHGFEGQSNYAIRNYPKVKGITTYMISGNHDMSFYKDAGADIVKYICSHRKDLKYAGMYYARFLDKSFKLDMIHPDGAPTYAKSYPIQRWIRNNEIPSTYPNVMVFGHYHQHGYFVDHEIACLMAGNFQRQNSYTLRRGWSSILGGWILDFKRKGKSLESLKLEWIKL